MCVTNIYVDRFPNGKEIEFRKFSNCQYGAPGRPCLTHSTLENPGRKIQFGEPTTEYMLTQPVFPSTPPSSSGGSHYRCSASERRSSISPSTSEEDHRRYHGKRASVKPSRTHRKERIVIVDAPLTPRTPPHVYPQKFTAPSSPKPPFGSPRSRPIIVDESSIRCARAPSVGAMVGKRLVHRHSSLSRPRFVWESSSSSQTSLDLRVEREQKEVTRREDVELDAEIRRARRIAEQDEEIRRRPAVPIPPRPLGQRPYLRPVVDQSKALQNVMGGLTLSEGIGEETLVDAAQLWRRLETRDRKLRERLEASEQQAMRQQLGERQIPKRRFSVGPGERRHRVLYDDGVYRWE